MRLTLRPATPADAPIVAALRNAAAETLTKQFGHGPWSSLATEKTVLFQMKYGTVYLALKGKSPLATVTLTKKKPWAHDRSYFTPCENPRYLIAMAVSPAHQRQGVGRASLEAIKKLAAKLPCDAICLDAYDHAAGAAPFYAKCGFKEVGRVSYRGTPLIYLEWLA